MKKGNVSGSLSLGGNEVNVSLPVLLFVQDGIQHVFSPHLNVVGVGYTEAEAKESFQISLEQFLHYTLEHGTLEGELQKLGWQVKQSSQKQYQAPEMSALVSASDMLKSVLDNLDFSVSRQQFQLPIAV